MPTNQKNETEVLPERSGGPLPSSRVVIAAGGQLGPWALPYLQEPGIFLIGADRGAWFLLSHGFRPDAALGDFDSVTPEEREAIRRGCGLYLDCDPVRKDWTDTEWALDWALTFRPSSVLLLGVTGTRLDHTLANIQLLLKASAQAVPCRIVDAHNEISLLSGPGNLVLTKGCYEQVSLIPLSGSVQGVTLRGFMYPLDEAVLESGRTLGVSNVVTEATATVAVREGQLLVIRSRD